MAQSRHGKHAGRLDAATVKASNDMDVMWAAVDKARRAFLGRVIAERPAGGVTIAEYAARYGLSRTTAQHQLNRMVQSGTVEQVMVMLPDAIGRTSRIAVYLPVKSKK